MDIIQMLALAERDQNTERARMNGHLGPCPAARPSQKVEELDFEDLDLEQIPGF